MKISLDTNRYDEISLEFDEEEKNGDLQSVFYEYSFAMASLYIDFAAKLSMSKENVISTGEGLMDATK